MTIIRRWSRIAVLLLALFALGAVAWTPAPVAAGTDPKADAAAPKTKDIVYLRSGRIAEGQILEETDTTVKMLVIVAGISAPVTYQRSEILSIERGVAAAGAATPTEKPAPAKGEHWTPESKPAKAASPAGDKPVVSLIELKGVIVGNGSTNIEGMARLNRRDIISYTPLRKAMDDALAQSPELIIVKMECESPGGFDGMFIAQPLAEIFQQAEDSGVKVVFWIKQALAGAALLPFASRQIYFTSDGLQGGIGDLGDFDIGDELVNEKQISLRLGAAEGVAIRAGYEPALIRAMAREENWLAVRWRGGKPEYIEWEPRPEDGDGWLVLSDDGKGKNKDESVFEGNDVLNIDADLAIKLLVSKGTYDKTDDLVFACGVRGEYDLLEERENRYFDEWRTGVENAIDRFQDLLRDLEREQSGASAGEVLGKRKRILEEMRGILGRFAEVFDFDGSQRAQIDVELEALKQEILRANEAERESQRNNNRRRRG